METETARNLPAKLVSLRKQKGITQMELAEKLNVSRQAISRWEVGSAVPTTDNLKVLSELYGVSIDYLLNDAAENVSKQNEVKQDQSSASETEEKNGFRNRRRLYIVNFFYNRFFHVGNLRYQHHLLPFFYYLILNVIQNIFALNYRIIPVFFLVIFELLILIYRLLLRSQQTDFEVQLVEHIFLSLLSLTVIN